MQRLGVESYPLALDALEDVPINRILIAAVLSGKVDGVVHVDNLQCPRTFHVRHPCSLSMLFGDSSNATFNAAFREYALNTHGERKEIEWLHAYPSAWDSMLQLELFADSLLRTEDTSVPIQSPATHTEPVIELHARVNFAFHLDKFQARVRRQADQQVTIVNMTADHFDTIQGAVCPRMFWRCGADFAANATGFCVLVNGELAAYSFAAYLLGNELEIAIETVAQHRGHGYAEVAAATLIDYCIEHGYSPVWSCRHSNVASYRLAQKLGFEPTKYIPYYKLSI